MTGMNLRNTTIAFAAAATFAVVGCGAEEEADIVDVPVVEEPAPAPVAPAEYEAPTPAPERAAEPEPVYVDPADALMPDEMRYRNSEGAESWSVLDEEEMDGFPDVTDSNANF